MIKRILYFLIFAIKFNITTFAFYCVIHMIVANISSIGLYSYILPVPSYTIPIVFQYNSIGYVFLLFAKNIAKLCFFPTLLPSYSSNTLSLTKCFTNNEILEKVDTNK